MCKGARAYSVIDYFIIITLHYVLWLKKLKVSSIKMFFIRLPECWSNYNILSPYLPSDSCTPILDCTVTVVKLWQSYFWRQSLYCQKILFSFLFSKIIAQQGWTSKYTTVTSLMSLDYLRISTSNYCFLIPITTN